MTAPIKTKEVRPLVLGEQKQDPGQLLQCVVDFAATSAKELRKSLPFLGRQRAVLTATEPKLRSSLQPEDDDESDADTPEGPAVIYECGNRGEAWLSLHLDSRAILALMDGLFTAPDEDEEDEDEEEEELPELGERLTLAQRALMRHVAKDICGIFSQCISQSTGLKFQGEEHIALDSSQNYEPALDAVSFDVEVEHVPHAWSLRLHIGSTGLGQAVVATQESASEIPPTTTLQQTLDPVPFEVVAELGRITMKLGKVLKLREGDIVRLSSVASDPVIVRVAGTPKFLASPVISRGQVAVSIESRHPD